MTSSEFSQDELDELLLLHSQHDLSDQQRLRLEELVRDNPEARTQILAYVRVDAQLQWRSSKAKDVDAATPLSVKPLSDKPGSSTADSRQRDQSIRWFVGVVLAALVLIGVWMNWPRKPVDSPNVSNPPLEIVNVPNVDIVPVVATRYEQPFHLAGWRIQVTKGSQYEISKTGNLVLMSGEAYVSGHYNPHVDADFEIETPAGRLQARGTRYFVATSQQTPENSETNENSEKSGTQTEEAGTVKNIGHQTRLCVLAGLVVFVNGFGEVEAGAGENAQATDTTPPAKLKAEGNYNEALQIYSKLVVDPGHTGESAAVDVGAALSCLQQLNREEEWDDLAEKIVASHKNDWRVLYAVARSFRNVQHFGSMIDNKFVRRSRGGRQVNTGQRDKLHTMQLMSQAMSHTAGDEDKLALFSFFEDFARYFPAGRAAWRLQYKTDLTALPDYGVPAYTDRTGGAPVNEDGTPVYHSLPKSWEKSQTDGQRWRWLVDQMAKADPSRADEMTLMLANFHLNQFGVQTMGYSPRIDPDGDIEDGPFTVHTLKDTETTARLATGPKRLTLPDEHNFIRLYQRVANNVPKRIKKSPLKNVSYKLYSGSWDKLPDFSKSKLVKGGENAAGLFDVKSVHLSENYGMTFAGTLVVPADGEYTIALNSDDGSRVRIGDDFEVVYDGLHGLDGPVTKKIELKKGEYRVSAEYFEKNGDEELVIYWTGPGIGKQYWTPAREVTPPERAMESLARIYENRLQYDKAAAQLRLAIKHFGPGKQSARQKHLNQIVDNWGRFESAPTFAHKQDVNLQYVFRNGKQVRFAARPINVELLIADIKAYLKSNPKQRDGRKSDPNSIGSSLVYYNEAKYLAKAEPISWDMKVEPRVRHWDRRIEVTAPIKKAGMYLLEAKMADGNASRVIVNITNTTLLSKPLHQKTLYIAADANSGDVIPNLNVEFFGYRHEYIRRENRKEEGRYYNVITRNFAGETDDQGMIIPNGNDLTNQFQWLAVARDEERSLFGLMGFNYVWRSDYNEANYQSIKAYVFADRPVYRPGQKVYFKGWVRAARYDMAYVSHMAGRKFRVQITDPRGQKFFDKSLASNEYAAVTDAITLDEDAPLGRYSVRVSEKPYVDPFTKKQVKERYLGGTNFRVEEYKKPEFEVTVEAPSDPVKLGDAFEATVKAKYYFGSPVTNGTVHYSIRRTERTDGYVPSRPWDWFYGPGYWWCGKSYRWYRGWDDWGYDIGYHRGSNPPEIVAENSVPIGKDGTIKIKIDSAVAKELFGHMDHSYTITAEVTDESRRTIVGTGSVIAGRKPFRVYAWMKGGHYRIGDPMVAKFQASRPDGKSVSAKGKVTLYQVTFDAMGESTEKVVRTWDVETDSSGSITQQMKATSAGQYRVACDLTTDKGHRRTGATFAVVTGDDKLKGNFRFNDLELSIDKSEYATGDRVRLLVNTNQKDSTVFLFTRPANGVYRKPEVIKMDGNGAVRSIDITRSDMPNMFVEALTISNGRVHSQMRKIVVPPQKRVVTVAVEPSEERYQPGENAKVKIRLTDPTGKPIVGETVVSIYDKSIEAIAGGHPAGDIRSFFWKWQRGHQIQQQHNLSRNYGLLFKKGEVSMQNLGVFAKLAMMNNSAKGMLASRNLRLFDSRGEDANSPNENFVVDLFEQQGGAKGEEIEKDGKFALGRGKENGRSGSAPEVAVRKDFADSAFWTGSVIADENGIAEIELPMPENLTAWKIHAWAMGHGTMVGEGVAEVITAKDLLIRLQAPRFFTQSDTVTLSANVHNYLKDKRDIDVRLELDGDVLELVAREQLKQSVAIDAGDDRRVDWTVKVVEPGEATVRMIAVTGDASDAMEMKFPAYVHGMLKTDSYSASIRPDGDSAKLTVTVPNERQPEQSHLEIRYSPSIALAMVDALPYLAGYEYKHSEAAVSRFVPLAVTRQILLDMKVDLDAVKNKLTNLNPQEIGDPKVRAAQWSKGRVNPVFDNDQVKRLVARGLRDLTSLQNGDGGWGWAPQSRTDAHSTAYVVHGLQTAKSYGQPLVPGMLERGVAWLENFQKVETQKITNYGIRDDKPRKSQASNLDAFVAMVLADAGKPNEKMLEYLYRDRTKLSVYALAMTGLTFDTLEKIEQRDMCLRNVKQYLVVDRENQTSRLNLPSKRYWWYWYGNEMEAHAYFLKLLARVEPKSETAAGVAKYLLNNRKHATWWNCTRDSALAVEALADFITASGETTPDMTVEILVDGKQHKEVHITADNLFTFDNVLHLYGDELTAGKHSVEIRRKGKGPVYLNAYMTNFTLEDFITKAGLEIKVERRYYKLVRDDKNIKASGSRGQALEYRVEHFKRVPLKSGDKLESGQLVEVELLLESKNDYEHLIFEDFKPAGLEAVSLTSGWVRNAYMELRDEKAVFLVRRLPVGKQTVSYRLRAEIPGKFSALPATGNGVYATELRANSDEIKLEVTE
jgi:uncharacterized protein YfaS (alpha-2-macroglobulin family)